MHLLFTDPSTSPRTRAGTRHLRRALRLSAVAPVSTARAPPACRRSTTSSPGAALESLGQADSIARRARGGSQPSIRRGSADRSAPRQRHVAYMSIWAIVFAVMSARRASAIVTPASGCRSGNEACRDGRPRACAYLAICSRFYCDAGSGWACNEAGSFRARAPALRRGDSAAGPPEATIVVRARMQARIRAGMPATPALSERRRGALRAAPPTLADYPDPACGAARDRSPTARPQRCTRAPASRAGPTRAVGHAPA